MRFVGGGLLLGGFIPWMLMLAAASAAAADNDPITIAAILTDEKSLGGAHDVELQDQWAFVAGKQGTVAIVDVKDPKQPRIVWSKHDPAELADAETVLPIGSYLLLGTRDFLSLDIADPTQTKIAATISQRPEIDVINGFARRGRFVFAANKRGWIDVFDITIPGRPRLADARNVRELDGIGSPHDLDVSDQLIVTVDGAGFGRMNKPGRVAIYQFRWPNSPSVLPQDVWLAYKPVESAELAGANRVRIAKGHAFVGASVGSQSAAGTRRGQGVVIDLKQPSQAKQVAAIEFPDKFGPNGQTVAGDVWFLAGGQTVAAIDIRDPQQPRLITAFRSEQAFPTAADNCHDLVYRDGYLYVTAQNDHRLVILHLADPELRKLADGG